MIPIPTSSGASDVPGEIDYQGQVRYRLDVIHQRVVVEGFERVVDPHIVRIDDDDTHRFMIDLSAGREYQIVGVCDNDCTDIDLRLYDPNGTLVDEDVLSDDMPVVSVTPTQSGRYAIEGIMYECSEDYCYVGLSAWAKQTKQEKVGQNQFSQNPISRDQIGVQRTASNTYEEQVFGHLQDVTAIYAERGFQRIGGIQLGTVQAGNTMRFTFEAAAAASLTGVCDNDCSDVNLHLYDANGTLLDQDVLEDDMPIVDVPGPGRYSAEVSVPGCSTSICYYAVGLYRR